MFFFVWRNVVLTRIHNGHSSLSQNAYQIECNWQWTNVPDLTNCTSFAYERKRWIATWRYFSQGRKNIMGVRTEPSTSTDVARVSDRSRQEFFVLGLE